MNSPGRYEFVQRQLNGTLQTLERRLRQLHPHHITAPRAVALLEVPSDRQHGQIIHRVDFVEAQLQELAEIEQY